MTIHHKATTNQHSIAQRTEDEIRPALGSIPLVTCLGVGGTRGLTSNCPQHIDKDVLQDT